VTFPQNAAVAPQTGPTANINDIGTAINRPTNLINEWVFMLFLLVQILASDGSGTSDIETLFTLFAGRHRF
jgi:hypothetical protein